MQILQVGNILPDALQMEPIKARPAIKKTHNYILEALIEETSEMINIISVEAYQNAPDSFKRLVTPGNLLLPFYFLLTFIEPPIHGKQRMYRIIKTMLLNPTALH